MVKNNDNDKDIKDIIDYFNEFEKLKKEMIYLTSPMILFFILLQEFLKEKKQIKYLKKEIKIKIIY